MANEEKNLSHATAKSVAELEILKEWWKTNGDKISMLAIAILAVIIGFQQYSRWSTRRNENAMTAYDQAQTPEALEALINKNASKTVTPLARLRLGNIFFQQGKYALAESVYETFLKETPHHEFADIAKVGLAHALEANGFIEKASETFKAFTENQPDSFLAPLATLGLGRTLILADRRDEGKAVLDLLIIETAGTQWAAFADEILRNRDRLTVPEAPGYADLSAFFPTDDADSATMAVDPQTEHASESFTNASTTQSAVPEKATESADQPDATDVEVDAE